MAADDRLLDLLAARATEGLDSGEMLEMKRLLVAQPDWHDDDLELAAAAAHVRAIERAGVEPMPGDLKRRVLGEAERFVGLDRRSDSSQADVVSIESAESPRRFGSTLRDLGWFAAAAMLVLAIWSPWSARDPIDTPVPNEPDAAAARAELIADAGDAVTASWSGAEAGYAEVSGDVVWSRARQAGFMRLRGLPANRPSKRQYQLWIVDPSRDAEPVDGGVFDIPAGAAEVIVPIDAKLEVGDPTVFAITLEQPGGVVVSEGPLLVVAALS